MIVDSGGMTRENELLNGPFVLLPMGKEHARSARHGEHKGVGGLHIAVDGRVTFVVVVATGVVIVDKGDCITGVIGVVAQASVGQTLPLSAVESRVDGVFQWEVKGCALDFPVHFGTFYPARYVVFVAIPKLSHRELRFHGRIIKSCISGGIALHHVITEAHIAKLFEQEVEISLHVFLCFGIGMVEIAEPIEVISRVSCAFYPAGYARIRVSVGLVGAANLTVVRVVPLHFVGLSRYGSRHILLCKVCPSVQTVLVVDDNIFDKARSFAPESPDHVAQFGLRSPATVVVKPETRVVSHRLSVAVIEVRCVT